MLRRTFLSAAAAPLVAQQARPFDLVVHGGELRDPSRQLKRRGDIGIRDGKIAAIEDSIPVSRGIQSLDASGSMVTPGLVDLHTHCYFGASSLGIDPNPTGARSGCTTWVDAGTFSYDQAGGFRKYVVEPAKVRVYGFVYLYPSSRNPDLDVIKYVRSFMKQTGETVLANRDILLGVKVQIGSNMQGRYSADFMKIARELCDEFKIPLMVHISFAPPDTDEVMRQMKPGDIITHMYSKHSLGIIGPDGKVKASVKEARARGVHFDIGHGLGSFNFEAAKKALDDGFRPDTISTDIYNLTVNGPVFDMPTTMSKMLHLGLGVDDIILASTATPGRIVNRVPMLGTLQPGAPADLALLRIEEGNFPVTDSQRTTINVPRRFVSKGTVCRGVRIG